MTQTVTPPAQRPTPPAKSTLPAGVVLAKTWREAPGGPLVKHDHERPVVDETDMPVGVWWMCPDPACKVGEWVFPTTDGQPGEPKKPGCPDHIQRLLPGRADPVDGDPKTAARNWLTQRLAEKSAAARKAASDAANARIAALRNAGREEAARLRADYREHLPSAVVSAAALVGDWALLENLDGLPGAALGACVAVGGMVLAYWTVYVGELVWARRMGYTLRELPRPIRRRAMSHARWIAAGVLSTGVWLVIGETIGADITNLRGLLMNAFAAVLIGVVNFNPWAQMVDRRKAAARAAQEAAEEAARAEEQRLADIEAERRRQQEAADAASRKVVATTDDHLAAGRKFADRWQRITDAARQRNDNPGFDLGRTAVVLEKTRKLTARDADGEVHIGWEFLIRAEPGVLTPRGGLDVSPFLMARRWLASMLEMEPAMLDLAYEPESEPDQNGNTKRLVNHGLITLSETFPLGENVDHPGAAGVFKNAKGWWAFAGRDLRGRPVMRRHWTPGQAGGAGRYGLTGSGKSVVTQVTAVGDLLLGIFPIVHDAGKSAMDFIDFYGIFPVGHTLEHREVIRESLWAEMKRRQAWTNRRTAVGLGGMEVPANPTWDPTVGGPPIRVTWEEFHMHMKDQRFVALLAEIIRLQRATAIMGELATQGTGLADTGDNNLREQVNQICMQLMRMTDHTARLAGYTGAAKTSDLPRIPGMMIMVDGDNEPIPYRSAFIGRDPGDERSLIYRLRDHTNVVDGQGQQLLYAPELPPETVEIFDRYGLMDLWELGKTKSGREALQSEADPVQSTVSLDGLAGLLNSQVKPAVKPRMQADEVVLAMLRHSTENGQPHMFEKDLLALPWWKQVQGQWSSGSGVPSASTVGRACVRLAEAEEPLVERNGDKQWSLTPAGFAQAEQPLTTLKATGVLGPQSKAQAQQAGVDVAAMERKAELEAEQARIMRELVEEANAAFHGK